MSESPKNTENTANTESVFDNTVTPAEVTVPEDQEPRFPALHETHVLGALTIENPHLVRDMDLSNCVVSLMVSSLTGKLWLDVNGISLLRFSPASDS